MSEPSPAGSMAFPYPASEQRLTALAAQHRDASIVEMLERDAERVSSFSLSAAGWHLDYSRHLLNVEIREALMELAEEAGLGEADGNLF